MAEPSRERRAAATTTTTTTTTTAAAPRSSLAAASYEQGRAQLKPPASKTDAAITAKAQLESVGPPQTIQAGDELARLYAAFEANYGQKTFYSGALSWLNNLVASAERVGDAVTGDSDRTWWGCADTAPALLTYFRSNYAGSDYTFELLTTRNIMGLQHNQVVAVPKSGAPRVFDPWSGGEVPYDGNHDNTLIAVGQALELVVTQDIEPTGYGDNRAVTGNRRLTP
jgi:hypothetical protein